MRGRVAVLVPIAVAAACRFGGPSANPEAYVPGDDAADQAMGDEHASPGDDGTVSATDAFVSFDDAPALGDESPADGLDAASPEGSPGTGGCSGSVAVCDPVHDTGCNPLQQCDVDPTQTTTPTGLCVFNSGSDAGGACIMSIVSESCAAKQTCVAGTCRSLCFCNADCPSGECCSDTSGPAGFTLCKTCP